MEALKFLRYIICTQFVYKLYAQCLLAYFFLNKIKYTAKNVAYTIWVRLCINRTSLNSNTQQIDQSGRQISDDEDQGLQGLVD
jgi:hypothetical protein